MSSGYTEMWQKDRSADAAGRLENLKELVRSMEEFENLQGFLEHISLVMERESGEGEQAVNIMTLHSAKGLEFDTVFLPGWEEGLFPHQRSLDESGRAGLEEERRLAHVGLTRARKRAKIYFATNRRIHGLWTSTLPSRFLDELPPRRRRGEGGRGRRRRLRHVGLRRLPLRRDEFLRLELHDARLAARAGAQGARRIFTRPASRAMCRMACSMTTRTAAAQTPITSPRIPLTSPLEGEVGRRKPAGRGVLRRAKRRAPLTIEGELIAKSTGATSLFAVGERVFHQKFGNGNVVAVDGNKLTIRFDKAGEKRVVDSFVERV